jgi:type IV pilus assembly protein PilV
MRATDMTTRDLNRGRRRPGGAERGFTMIEALVALVVLAIGLLGIAALYLDSLRAGRTAIYRTQAVNIAADLADRIRANRQGVLAYTSAFADTHVADANCDDAAVGCTAAEMAETDLARWKDTLGQQLPGGQGEVQVTAPAVAGDPGTYVITVRWTEVGEAAPVQYQLRLDI